MKKLIKEFGLYFIEYYRKIIKVVWEIIQLFVILIILIMLCILFTIPVVIASEYYDSLTALGLFGVLSTYFVLFPLYGFIIKKTGIFKLQIKDDK